MGNGLVSYLYKFLRTLKCKEHAVPSPFPGMDPYLEGYLWPDVRSALAHTIRQQLAPQIQPKYVARLEISVIEDQSPAAEIGIMYPDVEVIKVRASHPAPPDTPGDIAGAAAVVPITAPLTIPLPQVRLATVEIRDVAQNILVTSIEILSPGDTFPKLQDRFDDYLTMGVPNLWLLDPTSKRAWRITKDGHFEALDGILRTHDGILRTYDGQVVLPISDLFTS